MFEILLHFFTAIALGALIGTEREMTQLDHKGHKDERHMYGGIRTHILIAILGGLMMFLSTMTQNYWFVIIGFITTAFLIAISSAYSAFVHEELGITSEIAGLITYILGVLSLGGHASLAVMIGIVITIILVSKYYLQQLLKKVDRNELYSTLKFAVILFVILPVLPNQPLDPWGVINPYEVWTVVVLISGISYVGYLLSKFVGKSKGITIAGALGGLASSTAVTSSMAEQSKKTPSILFPFVIATIVASSMMFFRVLFWVYTFNADLLPSIIIPLLFMGISSALIVGGLFLYGWKMDMLEEKKTKEPDLQSPFQIIPAIQFGLFFVFVSFLSELALRYFGNHGTYFVSFFSGFADVDAITVKLSQESQAGNITHQVATVAIIIATVTNTIVKLLLAKFFGGKRFGNMTLVAMLLVIVAGLVGLLFI